MNIGFFPDALSYNNLLSERVYIDAFDLPCNSTYNRLGKSTSRYQEEKYQQQLRAESKRNQCELCKKNKKRSLATYIRNKSRSNSCNEICEEDEEDNTEQNNDVVNNVEKETYNIKTLTPKPETTIDENQDKPKKKSSKFSFFFKTVK